MIKGKGVEDIPKHNVKAKFWHLLYIGTKSLCIQFRQKRRNRETAYTSMTFHTFILV